MIQYAKNNQLFKQNKHATEIKSDITSEDSMYLLCYYYYGQILDKYNTQENTRQQTLQQALNIFDDFIDISITYDLYDEYIYDFLTKNKSFSRDILVQLNKNQIQNKQKFIQESKISFENSLLYLLYSKIYQVILDKKYIKDELEMINYGLEHKNDVIQQQPQQYKQPKVYQIDQQTIQLVKQENKFVPLDDIEQLKLKDLNRKIKQMKQQSRHDQDVQSYIEEKERIKNLSDSDMIDDNIQDHNDQQIKFGLINDGKPDQYKTVEKYRVDPNRQQQENQIDEIDAFYLEQKGLLQQTSDKETSEETKEKAQWEDWTDENRRGEGKKYNNIF